MTDIQPLTPEERAQKEEFERRDRMAGWSEREAARQATLAKVQPVLDALPTREEAAAMVAAISTNMPNLPFAIGEKLRPLHTVLQLYATSFLNEMDALITPEPEPVAPPAPAPVAAPAETDET